MPFVCFTDEQKEQARRTNLVELLRSQGETVKRSGSEYEWKTGSQKVTIRDNLWYHQYERVGGDAIDFVRRFYNKTYPEAMEYLLGDFHTSQHAGLFDEKPRTAHSVFRDAGKSGVVAVADVFSKSTVNQTVYQFLFRFHSVYKFFSRTNSICWHGPLPKTPREVRSACAAGTNRHNGHILPGRMHRVIRD